MKCASILVVEDEKDIRESLQQALEYEGYNVVVAANGLEGLEILPKLARPCLILLDLMMPVMNGWQFVEVLRQDDILATIPIVIISAYADKAKLIQTEGFVKKPIDLDSLFRIVGKYCGQVPSLPDSETRK